MIDIMAIRQSYERRELQEIRWINGQDNPADAMTKSNPNRALEKFLDTNHLQVRVEGWVKRGEQQQAQNSCFSFHKERTASVGIAAAVRPYDGVKGYG